MRLGKQKLTMLSTVGVLVITAIAVVVAAFLLNRSKRKRNAEILRSKRIAKATKERDYIRSNLETLDRQLAKEEVDAVLKLRTSELLAKLRSGNLKSGDVLRTYIYKACKVTSSLNCVTEVIRGCDKITEELTNERAGDCPLFGLPVSLKECMTVKGSFGTIGFSRHVDTPATDDCILAKVLKHQGAVPFVKTNVPQGTLSFESSNPIFGETSNPRNPDFGPGGSSSGEAALVGAGGSLLGFGTDTAGSIRGPAHLCGICGFKPTGNRISLVGLTTPYFMTSLTTAVGPMARDVETLVIAMRALLCDLMFKLDPNVVPLKFQDEIYASKKPMRIGYYDDNSFTKPFPACQRAVHIAKEALEKAGHTLVPFKIPDVAHAYNIAAKAIFADGGRTCIEITEGDEVDNCMKDMFRIWKMPRILLKLYAFLMSYKSPRMAADIMAIAGGGDASAYNVWKTRGQIERYKAMFWAEWRDKYNIEALIAPAYPLVACPKGFLKNSTGLSYTMLYNMLNGPAGVVPVTKVTQEDIDQLVDYEGHYRDEWDLHIKKACVGSIGMPVAVQCISFPWHDEVCLRLMKEVETLVARD